MHSNSTIYLCNTRTNQYQSSSYGNTLNAIIFFLIMFLEKKNCWWYRSAFVTYLFFLLWNSYDPLLSFWRWHCNRFFMTICSSAIDSSFSRFNNTTIIVGCLFVFPCCRYNLWSNFSTILMLLVVTFCCLQCNFHPCLHICLVLAHSHLEVLVVNILENVYVMKHMQKL